MAKKTTKPTTPSKSGALAKDPPKAASNNSSKASAPAANKPAPKAENKPAPKPNANSKDTPKNTKSGAMGKDPKQGKLPETSKRGNWKHNGVWVDKEGYKVDNYGKRIKGQSKPFVPAKSNPFIAKPPPSATPEAAPPVTAGPAEPLAPGEEPPLTPEQVADNVIVEGGGAYGGLVEDFEDFDPYAMQQKYQQGFTEEMNRARDNMMQQFERRNSEQFARERESTQQSILERGLDPNSPAAQAMQRDLNDRQDRARQEAYNAAEQQAYAVQQQAFGQAGQLAMMPYEQFATGIAPTFGIGLSAQYAQGEAGTQRDFQAKQAELQRQFDEAMRRGDRASAEKIAKMQQSNRGGGGNPNAASEAAYADYMNRLYGSQGQQQPQQTPGQAAGAGFGQGAIIGTVR